MEMRGLGRFGTICLVAIFLIISTIAQGICDSGSDRGSRGFPRSSSAAAESTSPVQSFGMKVENITPELRRQLGITQKSGVVVVGVEQGSVAADAGIQASDVIFEVNGGHIRNLTDYDEAIKKTQKGQPALFFVKRGKQAFYISMRVSGN